VVQGLFQFFLFVEFFLYDEGRRERKSEEERRVVPENIMLLQSRDNKGVKFLARTGERQKVTQLEPPPVLSK
jgi:hypothetical protein